MTETNALKIIDARMKRYDGFGKLIEEAREELRKEDEEIIKRTLTLEVIITDLEKASWIWDNHKGLDTNNGVYVQVIHEGPMPPFSQDLDD